MKPFILKSILIGIDKKYTWLETHTILIGNVILENKFLKLQQKVLAYSKSKNWEDATLEWDIIDFAEDAFINDLDISIRALNNIFFHRI